MSTITASSLYRLSSITLIIASLLTVVSNIALTLFFPNSGPTVPPSDVMSPLWDPIGIIGFVGGVLMLFGLVGLYLRQAKPTGVMGLVGFLLTFLGVLFASIVAGFFFISVLPYLATKGASAIEDGFSMVALFGLGGGVLLFLARSCWASLSSALESFHVWQESSSSWGTSSAPPRSWVSIWLSH